MTPAPHPGAKPPCPQVGTWRLRRLARVHRGCNRARELELRRTGAMFKVRHLSVSSCTWRGWSHAHSTAPITALASFPPKSSLEVPVTSRTAQAPPSGVHGRRDDAASPAWGPGGADADLDPASRHQAMNHGGQVRAQRPPHGASYSSKPGESRGQAPEDTPPWSVAKTRPVRQSAAPGTARLPVMRHLQERPVSAHQEGGR